MGAAFATAEFTSPRVGNTQTKSWALRIVHTGKPLTLLLLLQGGALILKIVAVSGKRNLENYPDPLQSKGRFCYASAMTL